MNHQPLHNFNYKALLFCASFLCVSFLVKSDKLSNLSVQNKLETNALDTLLVGSGETHTTIQSAYDVIPSPPDKEYWILIQGDYNPAGEVFPIIFANNNPDSNHRINIMPNLGVTGTIVSGDPGAALPLIDFFGADYIVFDGRPGGIGSSDLVIRNTRTLGDAGAVINLQEDASKNIIRYLSIEGEPDVMGFDALVNIGQTTGTDGNDSNTVANCVLSDLTVGGTALFPIKGIKSEGSFGTTNDYLAIDNCQLVDIWGGTNNASYYIHVLSNSTNFRITNNHFYQTTSFSNADFQSSFIQVDAGGGHIIDGNFIGGRAQNTGGDPYTITSGQAPFSMINMGFGLLSGDSVTIINNTLANFNITTANFMGASPGLVGIYNQGGGVRLIGTTDNGNTIGSPSAIGSIVFNDNNVMFSNSFAAILNSSNDSTYITDNTIGGITLGGSIGDVNAYMIYNEFGNVVVIDDNTIGGTIPNSITINSDVRCQGICNNSFSGNGVAVVNNTIRNVNHNASTWPFVGIQNDQDSIYCSGNTIGYVTVSSDSGMVGIAHYSFAQPAEISDNSILKITISNNGGGALFYGIEAHTDEDVLISGNSIGNAAANNISIASNTTSIGILVAGVGEYDVDGNTVQNFNQTSTGSSAELIGLAVLEGGVIASNNTITKLTSSTSASLESIIGIYVESDYPFYIIEGNTITDLEAVTTNGPDISGISLNSDVVGGYWAVVESNFISGLVGTNTSSATLIQGIYWYDGDVQISNNVVLLNNNGNNNATTLIGLYQDSPPGPGQNDIYHNTVSIEGVQAAGANTSVAYRIDDNNTTVIQNNIFKNIRSGGSGDYYAIEADNSGSYSVDYNFYDVAGAQPFSYGGTNRSFAQWKTSISGDGNSISGVELLDSEGRPTALFAGKDAGIDISGIITDDFAGDPRDAMPWMGAYEGTAPESGNKYVNDATFAGGDWTTSPGTDVGGCGDANNPCSTVQFAINEGSTSPGDTIFVDAGNYNTEFNTNINKGVVILGLSQSAVTFEESSAATNRRLFNVMSSDVVIKNITIKGFNATTNGFPRGGAIRIEEVDGVTEIDSIRFEDNQCLDGGAIGIRKTGGAENIVLISNSTFVSNSASSNGGAIQALSSAGGLTLEIFSNCIFGGSAANANSANQVGGAIFFNGDSLNIDSTTISYNTSGGSTDAGSGIYISCDESSISNSLVAYNSNSHPGTVANGGGIVVNSGVVDIERTQFEGNETDNNGGAIYVTGGGDVSVVNSLFFENDSKNRGSGVFVNDGQSELMNCTFADNITDSDNDSGTPMGTLGLTAGQQIDAFNSIFWDNSSGGNLDVNKGTGTLNLTNCVYQTSVAPANFSDLGGNNTGDPLFTNAAIDDYTLLSSSSSAVDAGSLVGAPATDFNGDMRPQGTGIDIGAYESGFSNSQYPEVAGAGSTVQFNGATKYGLVPTSPAIDLVGDWTIEAWVKRDAIGIQHSIIEKYNNAPGFGGYALRINGANKLTALHFNGTLFDQAIGSTNILANQWYHVAATFNNTSNTITVYVNGISDGAGVASLAPLSSSVDLKIGARGNDQATKMDGEIDEVRLWNTVLTVSEIREYMCQKVTSSHPQAGSVGAVYPFDDSGSPGILQDLLGNNNATFNGVVAGDWVTSGVPIGDTSVYNYGGSSLSASLDGVNNNDFAVSDYAGTIDGMHIYFVNDTINSSAIPSGMAGIDSVGYYGVFKVGSTDASYTATIDYTNNVAINGQPNEANIRIANRSSNDAGATSLSTGAIRTNTADNTITIPGQTGTEFVVGYATAGYPNEPGAGYTLLMDGTNEFVSLPNQITTAHNNLTFEAWFKWDGNGTATNRTIILNGNSSANGQHIYLASGTNEISANFGGVGNFGSGINAQPNQWMHVALLGNGSNAWVLYVNGVFGASGVHTPNTPSGVFNIGANQAGGEVFSGEIDEVRVWNTFLNQAKIRDYLCNKSLTSHPNYANLLAYYRFDEGSGNSLSDLAGANIMTLNNMEPTDWIYSGAYIGDSSVHNYINTSDLVLVSPTGGAVTIHNIDGNADSLHLYFVADTANDLSGPVGVDSLDKRNYWGVFDAGFTSDDVTRVKFDYTLHPDIPGHVNEGGMRIVGRQDPSTSTSWGFPTLPTIVTNYPANDSIVIDTISGSYEFVAAYAEGVGPNYYVNDAVLVGDVFTTNPGTDAANCGTSSNPCATVQYVIDNYDLGFGDTISIDAGNYSESNITFTSTDDSVIVTGASETATVFLSPGGSNVHCFDIQAAGVTISNLRIDAYDARLAAVSFGGGILIQNVAGQTTIQDVQIENCEANSGGAIAVVHNAASIGHVSIIGGEIHSNDAAADGAGVYVNRLNGNLSMSIYGRAHIGSIGPNDASSGNGGNIYFNADTLSIDTSAVTNGTAINGAGIYVNDGVFYMNNDVTDFIVSNTATGDGGNIYLGAGVDSAYIFDSYVDNGSATGDGGNIYTESELYVEISNINQGTATNGGGIYTTSDLHILNNSTLGLSGGFGNSASARGGAIYLAGDTLTMTNSNIWFGVSSQSGDAGGGIYANGNAFVSITNSSIEGCDANDVDGRGGAIALAGNATLQLDGSELRASNAEDRGAGIYAETGTQVYVINNSLILGDAAGTTVRATDGGGIYFEGDSLYIANSRIQGNRVSNDGGGIYTSADAYIYDSKIDSNRADQGGGIRIQSGAIVILERDTIQINTADFQGAGISLNSSTLTIDSCRVYLNDAANNGGGLHASGTAIATIQNHTRIRSDGSTIVADDGGGVYFNGTSLTIDSSWIYSLNVGSNGAGLYVSGTTDVILRNASLISDNDAGNNGGGIYATLGASFTIQDSTQIGENGFPNNALSRGGGVYWNSTDTLQVTDSYIHFNNAQNTAVAGGGVYTRAGYINLTKSFVQNNGSIGVGGDGAGLCVDNAAATIDIIQTNISNNTANDDGSAIFHADGDVTLINSLVYSNSNATGDHALVSENGDMVIFNSTIANNANSVFAVQVDIGVTGGITNTILYGNNPGDINVADNVYVIDHVVYGSGNVGVSAGPNLYTADPLFNNMPADDYTLASGSSSAVDVGTAVGAPSVDYNDTIRPIGGFYDIGAYEALVCGAPLLVTSSANDSVCGTLRFALGEAITNPGADTIRFDTIAMGGHSILPLTPLPTIAGANAHGTVIWGDIGNDNTPDVELDGSLMATVGIDSAGVVIQADTVTIRSMVINRFSGSGILFDNADTGFVIGCYLGSTYDGSDTAGNNIGVNLVNGSRANTIGDGTQFGGNLIGGNDGEISLTFANSNYFYGNKIATNLAGNGYLGGALAKIGNGAFGLSSSDSVIIGDTALYHDNTITAKQFGLFVASCDHFVVRGNHFGTDATGTANLGISGGGQAFALSGVNNWQIDHNDIANCAGAGIRFPDAASFDNRIHYNRFWNNGVFGAIWVQNVNAQESIQPPIISSLMLDSTLSGTSEPNAFIQIYADSTDEGYYFIDTTYANALGEWELKIDLTSLAPGVDSLRALQDSSLNTSDFTTGFFIEFCDPLIVTSAADDSLCGDLRFAIGYAISNPGPDTITFDTLAMGTNVISLVSELPAISGVNSDSTFIDGDINNDCAPDIQLDAGGSSVALDLNFVEGARIEGLAIVNFTSEGVYIRGLGTDNNILTNCYVGLERDGLTTNGGSRGIHINSSAANNLIGVAGNGCGGNVISGNSQGIQVNISPTGNVIVNNKVGTDASGLLDRGNSSHGLFIQNPTQIGGTGPFEGNVISGNNNRGIFVGGMSNSVIEGNIIGLGVDSITQIPNGSDGIEFFSNTNQNDTIRYNMIAYNGGFGIQTVSVNSDNNIFSQNSIYENALGGISEDAGTQDDVLQPTISSILIIGTDTIVNGTSAPLAHVELYSDSTNQGQHYLNDTIANGSGAWGIVINGLGVFDVNGLDSLTAIQDSAGNTSEFSAPIFKNAFCNPLVVSSTADDSLCGDLRFALGFAISNPGPDTVTFVAGLSNGVISLTSVLPNLSTDSTVVDGDFIGSDCEPDITIDGGDLAFDGFEISGSHNILKGLNMINFAGSTSNAAVLIDGGDSNTVVCSYIGTNLTGTAVSGATDNDIGVYVTNGGRGNVIGDSTGATVNLICGNTSYGVYLENVDTNFVVANLIGLDILGTTGLGNADHGVFLEGAQGNFVVSNIISDNGATGVTLDNSRGNLVSGNNIGGNFAGTADIGNTAQGVMLINGSNGNSIGGSTLSRRNFIIGNNGGGVQVETDSNSVSGNFIGIGKDGVTTIPNSAGGITLTQGASSNFIGDTTYYGRNVVSGNTGHGISISNAGGPASNNFIIGNYVGTDSTGTIDRGNTNNGINVASESNIIGTGQANSRNVISGNGFSGISITATNGDIIVAGNLVGLTVDSLPLGNSISGVQITGGSNDTLFANVIAYNTNSGVSITGGATNKHIVRANSVYKNGSIGISHVLNSQESILAPVITSLTVVGIDTILSGTSEQNALIQIFCDSTNQGQVFLDTTLADGSGNWKKIINGFGINDANGLDSLTALQDSAGNTSAFSLPFFKNPSCSTPLVVTSAVNDSTCGTLRFAIGYANNNPGADTITFDTTAMGGHTIQPSTILPAITGDSTVIWGDLTNDGDPDIELDGSALGGAEDGLEIQANHVLVKGLIINGFPNNGIYANGSLADSTMIRSCYIGLDYNGSSADGNGANGVEFVNVKHASVGDGSANGRNIISGNTSAGIKFDGADSSTVLNNYIGTDLAGLVDVGNGTAGIELAGVSVRNTIGQPGMGNVIGGNDERSIDFNSTSCLNNVIASNYLGTDLTGNVTMTGQFQALSLSGDSNIVGLPVPGGGNVLVGNLAEHIFIFGKENILRNNKIGIGADSSSLLNRTLSSGLLIAGDSNTIGGFGAYEGNVITRSGNNGIDIAGGGSTGNLFHANSLVDHDGEAVVLALGSQLGLLAPIITGVAVVGTDTLVSGTSTINALIQLYCDSTNEGLAFLDTTYANASGAWEININNMGVYSSGLDSLTALQDSVGNTSAFSPAVSKNFCDTTGAIVGTWTWTGAVSSDWFDCGNWDMGSLPNSQVDVSIPGATANDPMIAAGTAYCKRININVANGAIVNLNSSAGGVLDIGP